MLVLFSRPGANKTGMQRFMCFFHAPLSDSIPMLTWGPIVPRSWRSTAHSDPKRRVASLRLGKRIESGSPSKPLLSQRRSTHMKPQLSSVPGAYVGSCNCNFKTLPSVRQSWACYWIPSPPIVSFNFLNLILQVRSGRAGGRKFQISEQL